MRIQVSAEKEQLEEEHAGRPDSGRAAEPGKDVLPDERLDLKQQERAQKDRERVESGERSGSPADAGLGGGRRNAFGCPGDRGRKRRRIAHWGGTVRRERIPNP